MFFIIREMIVWTIWFFFADKKRWRELFIPAMFAGLLAILTDHLMHHYLLWHYHPKGEISQLTIELFDDFGMYMVVTYLFIQWLPKKQSGWIMFQYWFVWTGFAIGIEWIHLFTGHMEHHKWWNLGYSYLADWLLFWLFYWFHKIFRLEKLTSDC